MTCRRRAAYCGPSPQLCGRRYQIGDEPVVHVYAEGRTPEESDALEWELRSIVEEILAAEESAVGA